MSLFYFPYPATAPVDSELVVVEIDARIVPYIVSSIERYKYRQFWATEDDYRRGFEALCIAQEGMLMGTQDIVIAVNQVYRLLDSALNGVQYTASGDPVVVTPEIPAAPANAVGQAPGLRRQLLDLQGEINELWFGIGGQPATLADVVNALRVGKPQDAARIDTALEALGAASSSSVIFNTVRDLFSDVVQGGLEGATLGTLIASSIANAAMLGSMAGQIDRLIASLDGGGMVGPEDNVLTALRGITLAGEARNVIDAVGSGGLVQLLDEVEALLIQIRDKVQ